MTAYREFRQKADDIDPCLEEEVKERDLEAFREDQGEPWLFDLLMSERKSYKKGTTV